MFIFIAKAKRSGKERKINLRLDDNGLQSEAKAKTARKKKRKGKEQKRTEKRSIQVNINNEM